MKSVIREHILVCLSSAPSNGSIIRTGAKMRDAFGGTLTALYVQTGRTERMSPEDRKRLQRNTRLAEKLGASVSTVSGEDVAYQIAEFARLSKVTKVVLGRSNPPQLRLFGQRPLTERLVELAPDLDIFIIPDTAGENRSRRNPTARRRRLPGLREIAVTGLLLGLATLVGFLFHDLRFTEANTITVYILGVLLTALFTKNDVCSGVSALASVLLFNFFFTEPRLSFYAYESGYPVTFAIMLIAALITGTLANRLADSAKQSAHAEWRTRILLDTTQQLQKAPGPEAVLQVVAGQVTKLLNRPVVIYPVVGGTLGQPSGSAPEQDEGGFAGEERIADWVFRNQKRAGASTEVFPDARGLYLAIRSEGDVYGVVGVPAGEQPLEPFENSILLSILGEAALAMESQRNAMEKEAAAVLAKNEQLRADLLRSISHDLRTPLTAISGNAENLISNEEAMDQETRKSVLTDIYEDSIWLIRLVENLLAITRIGEGRTRLNLTTELVDDVITEALRHIRRQESVHPVRLQLPEELLLARMDARLISQVIINLVDNAMKHTPAGSEIQITAGRQGQRITIQVADNGPGIPDGQKDKAFDMFYTGDTKVADCRRSMGLGLALCKSIVSLHGGEITLTDNTPTGCVFTVTLPASEVTINE